MARTPDAEPVRRDVGVGLTSDARSKKDDAAPRQSPWDMRGANASANRKSQNDNVVCTLYVYVVGGTAQLSKRVDKSQEQAISAIDHVGDCYGAFNLVPAPACSREDLPLLPFSSIRLESATGRLSFVQLLYKPCFL